MSAQNLPLDWLKRAKRDLANIENWYLQTAGEQVSDAAVDAIWYQAGRIQERPMLYRKGSRPGTHEAVVKKFPLLILYRVKPKCIRVLRVFHQRQGRP